MNNQPNEGQFCSPTQLFDMLQQYQHHQTQIQSQTDTLAQFDSKPEYSPPMLSLIGMFNNLVKIVSQYHAENLHLVKQHHRQLNKQYQQQQLKSLWSNQLTALGSPTVTGLLAQLTPSAQSTTTHSINRLFVSMLPFGQKLSVDGNNDDDSSQSTGTGLDLIEALAKVF